MLHACFYTICILFRYTLWHFYAFSRTNLLTSCHSASFLFSAIFVFQKWYTGNILEIGRNKFLKSYFTWKLLEIQRRVGGRGPGAHMHRWCDQPLAHASPSVAAWPLLWHRPFAYKDPPQRKKPKYPIRFPEHIAIHHRHWPEDREGPEALPSTLPERGIAIGGSFSSPSLPPEQ
jgi:hypothetical protein